MGLMDKVKQVAGDVGEAAKKGASQVQTKVEQTQLRRKADDAAKQLGYLLYRERTGGDPAGDEAERLIAEIREVEDELAVAGAAKPSGAKAVDPVCGMNVDVATATFMTDYGDTTYYFSSKACLDRFAADPETFAASSAARGAEVPTPPPEQPGGEAAGE